MEIRETVFDHIRSRPRFKIFTEKSREACTAVFKSHLKKDKTFSGNINSEIATIQVNNGDFSYWKPCLALRTETDEETGKTAIRGIFGPSSAVWTFFMFTYFILGILLMVTLTLWLVTRQIGNAEFAWAKGGSFLLVVLLLITYIAAQVGKTKSKTEMKQLRDFAEAAVRQLENQEESFADDFKDLT